MLADNGVKERLAIKSIENAASAMRSDHELVLQRYGRIELRYSDSIDAASPAALLSLESAELSLTERFALEAFQFRQSDAYKAVKMARPRDKEPWDMDGCAKMPPMPIAGAASSSSPSSAPASGWLEGSVAVGTVIVNGPTDDLRFTGAEQTKVIAEVQTGLSWLASQAFSSKMTFVHDIRLASIDQPANPNAPDLEGLWRDAAMASLGYSASWQGVIDYVNSLRDQMNTDWAYAVFFVKYPLGHFAYAYIGGPHIVMQYANDGWGPDNIDRVFAHETGHIFRCPDEYGASGCNCGGEWGRFLEPNRNCENCAGDAVVSCIMSHNDWTTCQSTRAHFGWSGWASPIIAVHSNKVLDVSFASAEAGAQIIQWPWHGGSNQQFLADPLEDGTFRLIAENSGLVLDVAGASTEPGAKLTQYSWHGGDNQRFRLERQHDGTYRIVAKHSGLVLDVEGASLNRADISQYPWHGGNNQRFRILSRGISIQAVHSGLVLDVRWASFDYGMDLVQYPLHGGGNQRFRLDPLGDGTWRILVEHSSLVLDVAGASTEPGAKITQYPWHGGNNQRFRIYPLGDGTFCIMAVHSSLVLDVSCASVDNGAEITQWTWHGGANQRFRFV